MTKFHYIPALDTAVTDIPDDGVVSRTLLKNDDLQMLVFGFAPGQELSEHTASRPAVLHFLEGNATVTLGEERFEVEAGAWVYMPAHLPHSIEAKSRVLMQLMLLAE